MIQITTSIDIDAPRQDVWAHLTDLASYPEWNPHVVAAEGHLEPGERLRIRVARDGAPTRDMRVTVTAVDPDRRLEWVGRLGRGLLFEGRHTVELESLPSGRTRLHNREQVSGLLASLLVTDAPARDYERMNETLKARVERTAAEQAPE
jgi:hypothetical protein